MTFPRNALENESSKQGKELVRNMSVYVWNGAKLNLPGCLFCCISSRGDKMQALGGIELNFVMISASETEQKKDRNGS